MIRVTLRSALGREPAWERIYGGHSVTIVGDALKVDGQTIAVKWGTPRGPWLREGQAFEIVEIEQVDPITGSAE